MNLTSALQIVATAALSAVGSVYLVLQFLKISKEFNPLIKIHKRLDEHEEKLEQHDERIEVNKFDIVKATAALAVHKDSFDESQYVILKSIKALLDHEINPENADISRASRDLEEYLLKK